ncbi:MAG: cupredoxin domain-containing protein [Actinomycetota bacterium]|nr:cupredoxin domain-containing protein [Actinomycetota bacterium]
MRIVVLSAVAVLALAVTGASQPASTATKAVKISATAFSPGSVTINTGDAVKWTNSDSKNHQVVANNGAFASPTIAPGKTYTHVFNTAGTYRYHDALHPSLTGRVIVNGPPPAITIGASLPILTYGQATHVSGAVSNKKTGESVTVYAQPFGQASPAQIATLLTSADGVWDLVVKPTLLTAYEAHWKSTISAKINLQMRPNVLFSATKGMGFVKVKSNHSLQGRKVYVQRFTRFGQWVKMKRVILGRSSQRLFYLRLPRGTYTLRVFMSYNQAGAGYLDGFSRTITFKRR